MGCRVPVIPPLSSPTPPPSNNADLSSLTVSSGTLVPAFSASTIDYTVSVPNAITSLTVAGTKADATASLVINPAGQPMSLVVGVNTVTLTVTPTSGAAKVYTVQITRAPLLVMISIPGGTFQRDATTTNTSSVSAFKMSQTEITREQFVAVTGLADPSNPTKSIGITDPVQQVNWYHALVFSNKLSMSEGLTPVYTISGSTDPAVWGLVPAVSNATWNAATANWSANGYRLPTEMEWMWAAMGATSGIGDHSGGIFTNGYLKDFAGDPNPISSGDDPSSYAWFNKTTTTIANSLTANELGLKGMSGNVWEWCWDLYDVIAPGSNSDYHGAVSGTYRVLHGGGWEDPTLDSPSIRGFNIPELKYITLGFRVVSQ